MKNLKFEHPIMNIYIDGDILYADWLQNTTLPEFQTVLNMGAMLAQKYKCTKWIGDTRELGVVPAGGQEWLQHVWNLEVSEAGITHIAVVFSDDIFNQLTLEEYSENANKLPGGRLSTQIFASIEGAEAWIKQLTTND